jgi:AcrR family transcriptional regulator
MADRKQQILQHAVELVADLGYGALTMRAVARASGLKLGALQYHFRTWNDLLHALATYIGDTYRASFNAYTSDGEPPSLEQILGFLIDDPPGAGLHVERLLPQLWAMALVEPIMADLMDDLYQEYVDFLEARLAERGVPEPQAEALVLMGMLEGLTLFVGPARRWQDSGPAVLEVVQSLIQQRYGVVRVT